MCSSYVRLQEYDLSELHRGLDNRPEVFSTDVFPNTQSRPRYRQQIRANEEIGKFLEDVRKVKFYTLRQYFFLANNWLISCGNIYLLYFCRTCMLPTMTPQLPLTTVCWSSTMKVSVRRPGLSVRSAQPRMRSWVFTDWPSGGHVSAGWLTCTQDGRRRTTIQRHCLEKQSGSDWVAAFVIQLWLLVSGLLSSFQEI